MWAWSDPSLPVQLNHGQLKGRGRMTCSSVDIIDVVRCRILLLPPPFQCTTLSMWRLALSRTSGIKPGYVASGWVWHSQPHGQLDGTSV